MIETFRLMADPAYKSFQSKLLPTVADDRIIGVRTPELRAYAKAMDLNDAELFMNNLPHIYYEENNLHGFLIERIKDFGKCICALDQFLPYVDNWATCDGMKPKCLAKDKEALVKKIYQWIQSEHTYTVRYGILMLMTHFLDDDFKPDYLNVVASVGNAEYYVRMMIAWYFATALAKQWDCTITYITEKRLPRWVHNKAIQKSIESYRITPEQKLFLRKIRV